MNSYKQVEIPNLHLISPTLPHLHLLMGGYALELVNQIFNVTRQQSHRGYAALEEL